MAKYPVEGLIGVTPADLSWLTGSWKGHRGDDVVEEHWSGLGGGTLMGMFRWQKGEQVWFYELMVIEQAEAHVYLRLKHFYPGLKGWEEKDQATEFLLVQLQNREAIFLQTNKPNAPWIIYRLEGDDKLVTYFEREEDTPAETDKFFYFRLQT
ncbi:MAG: hypothetical protein KF770_32065 [Anaerolineae bacterium]|nr:hypothetical protein [Anaerolineae bacterium]